MLSKLFGAKSKMIDPAEASPGHADYTYEIPETHTVLGTPLQPPFPDGVETAYFALGCFWGAEKLFWEHPGVYSTAVGYQDGYTPYPTYQEVCTGKTGHAEAVMVAFDPDQTSYESLVRLFFEEHDPTQGMRQGADSGTQYRSAIYTTSAAQTATASQVKATYEPLLKHAGHGPITTEIEEAAMFYYAEDYHQQYLDKVPNGYCSMKGTGVSCPVPWATPETESRVAPLPETEEEWKSRLTPEQYKVLRQASTERPFTSEYNNSKADGMFRCAACSNLLFDSSTKFESGTGWPSFTNAIPGAVELEVDRTLGMARTEVRCARCHSHLGHVFNDGPREAGGQRFCMNGCALDLAERPA